MKSRSSLYKRHRFPSEIIQYVVWLYHRFNLSNRDIEDLLLIGNNLSDEMILNNGQVFLANAGYLKTSRRISLQGTYRFGR